MEQQFHPVVFALIAYGVAAVIAGCGTFIIKAIASFVREKKPADTRDAKPQK